MILINIGLRKHTARLSLIVPGFFLLCLLAACGAGKKHDIQPAFYYWKTNFRPGTYERQVLQTTGTRTLYLRLFDVDWNQDRQKALPIGILQSDPVSDTALQYIPVVYITQPCLTRLQEKDLPELAANISNLINQLCGRYHIQPPELQIDCDWTKNSASLYFSLLKQLKQQDFFKEKTLSCTIRLHQVKYTTSSGIPPVDRGMLMVYNMGNLTKYGSHNSILAPEEAKAYLRALGTYPLPLDVALPIYHWAALFEHKRFKGILYNVRQAQFADDVLEHKEGYLYRVRKDGSSGGYNLKEGQEIRFEDPVAEDLEDIAAYIGQRIQDSSFRLAFFHLDSSAMQPYTPADFKKIIEAF